MRCRWHWENINAGSFHAGYARLQKAFRPTWNKSAKRGRLILLLELIFLDYISRWPQPIIPGTFCRLSGGKCSDGPGWGARDSHRGPETTQRCYQCSRRPCCSISPLSHHTQLRVPPSWSGSGMEICGMRAIILPILPPSPWQTLLIHHGGLFWKVWMWSLNAPKHSTPNIRHLSNI